MKQHCTGLIQNTAGGKHCRHGHATTQGCFGVGYPTGVPVPVCVREDKVFDEQQQTVGIRDWKGDDHA